MILEPTMETATMTLTILATLFASILAFAGYDLSHNPTKPKPAKIK